ncbi:trypsin-like peptidase domain-containing protein [Aggregatilineales bacterium SYSU G02658]
MSVWKQINDEAARVASVVARSVVQLVGQEGSLGAAVVWRADGLLVTNAHVAVGQRGARTLEAVFHDDQRLSARLLAYDLERDLAALHVARADLTPVAVGDSSQLRAGEYVMALGHPWGVVDGLTGGVLIGGGTQLPEMQGQDWLAVDLPMRPGHSGGALFNAAGELVGINTLIRGPEVSFAVPVNAVKLFMREVTAQQAASASVV